MNKIDLIGQEMDEDEIKEIIDWDIKSFRVNRLQAKLYGVPIPFTSVGSPSSTSYKCWFCGYSGQISNPTAIKFHLNNCKGSKYGS